MDEKKYEDALLNSLYEVYRKNSDDLNLKKFFALELYKKGQLRDSYPLLLELLELDQDLNIQKVINDIETKVPEINKPAFGFGGERQAAEDALEKLGRITEGKITFADVAGMDHVKEAIRTDILYPLQNPELAKMYKMKVGGGIMMYGPPGCGKTFIARATAGEINAAFMSISLHEVISAWIGESEKMLHHWFEEARRNKPAVLFFDEIDAVGVSRSRAVGHLRTMVNQFLVELDGMGNDNREVLVIGATNMPWEVDSALRRPGRFDKVVFVPPPDAAARQRLFQLSLKEKPIGELDYARLASLSIDFSSADVGRVCDEAADRAFKLALVKGAAEPIGQESLEDCVKACRSSVQEWFATAQNYVQYSNESGLWDDVKKYLAEKKDAKKGR